MVTICGGIGTNPGSSGRTTTSSNLGSGRTSDGTWGSRGSKQVAALAPAPMQVAMEPVAIQAAVEPAPAAIWTAAKPAPAIIAAEPAPAAIRAVVEPALEAIRAVAVIRKAVVGGGKNPTHQ